MKKRESGKGRKCVRERKRVGVEEATKCIAISFVVQKVMQMVAASNRENSFLFGVPADWWAWMGVCCVCVCYGRGTGWLTTWRKKSKSSKLLDAAGVVDLLRPVVVFPRRVVVAGTFCNKSSISLILIGKPVVVVVLVAVVVLILSPVGARAFVWLFPRLQTWNAEINKNERNSLEHTLSVNQMVFLSLSARI